MREIPFSLVQFPLYEYMKVNIILLNDSSWNEWMDVCLHVEFICIASTCCVCTPMILSVSPAIAHIVLLIMTQPRLLLYLSKLLPSFNGDWWQLSIYSNCPSFNETIAIRPSIHPSIHPFIYPSIHPSIHPFIHPSILYVWYGSQ